MQVFTFKGWQATLDGKAFPTLYELESDALSEARRIAELAGGGKPGTVWFEETCTAAELAKALADFVSPEDVPKGIQIMQGV